MTGTAKSDTAGLFAITGRESAAARAAAGYAGRPKYAYVTKCQGRVPALAFVLFFRLGIGVCAVIIEKQQQNSYSR